MVEIFLKYIREKSQVDPIDFPKIQAVCQIKKIRKRQYLMHEGDIYKDVVFVTKGCLRSFSIDMEGREHTFYIAIENWWTGDRHCYLTEEPTKFNIDAVEDSEVVIITKECFDALCKELPLFNDMINIILQKSFITNQNRIHGYVCNSAQEKYREFKEKYPDMLDRIPQSIIASFLGIAPETLSRIRRQLFKKL
jgi:CRP-like cAMP-binding protein